MNESSIIKEIGRSYIVSSLLPAGFFITLGIFIYRSLIPKILITAVPFDHFSISLVILYCTLIMWVGFALYSIVNWTVRIYEGYYLPEGIKKILVTLFHKGVHNRKSKNIRIIQWANKVQPLNWDSYTEKYYDQAVADYADLELTSPIEHKDLLPTKLGNVLRASEQYPLRYGLTAGIQIWTRLVVILPPNISKELEEKNNNMIFLLNSSLLCYLIGAFSFFFWITLK